MFLRRTVTKPENLLRERYTMKYIDLLAAGKEKAKQREILRDIYPDYDPKLHYKFVILYNRELEGERVKL